MVHTNGVTHGNRGNNSSLQEMRTVCGATEYQHVGSFVALAGTESDYVEVRRRGNGNRCGIYSSPTTNTASYQEADVNPNNTRHRMVKPGVRKTTKLDGGDDNTAPVVDRFLLLERGNGLGWVELADVKSFQKHKAVGRSGSPSSLCITCSAGAQRQNSPTASSDEANLQWLRGQAWDVKAGLASLGLRRRDTPRAP